MNDNDVRLFMKLGGQKISEKLNGMDETSRILGAKLLLSEVLEYVIKGLGVTPMVNGEKITCGDSLKYEIGRKDVDLVEMLDGLADAQFTTYWNKQRFGIPLEEAFDEVCKNNLEKFIPLPKDGTFKLGKLDKAQWGLGKGITWGADVVSVSCVEVEGRYFGVGQDEHGKTRKPSSYRPIDLTGLVAKYTK